MLPWSGGGWGGNGSGRRGWRSIPTVEPLLMGQFDPTKRVNDRCISIAQISITPIVSCAVINCADFNRRLHMSETVLF